MYYRGLAGLGLTALSADQISAAAAFILANLNNPAAIARKCRDLGVTVENLITIVGSVNPSLANRYGITSYFNGAGIGIGADDIPDPDGTHRASVFATQTAPATVTTTPSQTGYTQAQIDAAVTAAANAAAAAARAAGGTAAQIQAAGDAAAQAVSGTASTITWADGTLAPNTPAPAASQISDIVTTISGLPWYALAGGALLLWKIIK